MPSPEKPAVLQDQIRYLLGQLAAVSDYRVGRPHAFNAMAPSWYRLGYERAWQEETQKRTAQRVLVS